MKYIVFYMVLVTLAGFAAVSLGMLALGYQALAYLLGPAAL